MTASVFDETITKYEAVGLLVDARQLGYNEAVAELLQKFCQLLGFDYDDWIDECGRRAYLHWLESKEGKDAQG